MRGRMFVRCLQIWSIVALFVLLPDLHPVSGATYPMPFSDPLETPVGPGPVAFASADFNGDRVPDLAVENGDGSLSVLIASGNGGFFVKGPGVSLGTSGDHGPAHSLVTGDFDNDGHADVAMLFHSAGQVKILFGTGNSTFSNPAFRPVSSISSVVSSPDELVVGDIDLDGIPDLIVAGDTQLVVLKGDGVGGFSQIGSPTALAAAPIDMVFAIFGAGSVATGARGVALLQSGVDTVTVLKSDGTGNFTPVAVTPNTIGTNPTAIAKWIEPDNRTAGLAVTYAGNRSVNVLVGSGGGEFQLAYGGPITSGISTNPRAIVAGDVNGDGHDDLVIANNSGTTDTSVINVLTGNSDASFTSTIPIAVNGYSEPRALILADVTRDTKPDLLALNVSTNLVSTSISIAPYAATSFSVSVPVSTAPGASFQITVTARDRLGNVATGYRGTVHFSGGGAGATLPNDTFFSSTDNGVHTFAATLSTPGTTTITATDTITSTLTGSATVYIIPQPATRFVVAAPQSATAGTSFSLTVTAQDASGNTVTAYTGALRFTSSDALAMLPDEYGFVAADSGTHVFAATLRSAGVQTLTATMVGNTSVNGVQSISVNGPTVTGVHPSSVLATTNVSFTLSGTGFTGATSVKFGGADAQAFVVTNDTTITGTTPINQTPGTVDVTVTTPQGSASIHGFTFLPAAVAPLPAPKPPSGGGANEPPAPIPNRRP